MSDAPKPSANRQVWGFRILGLILLVTGLYLGGPSAWKNTSTALPKLKENKWSFAKAKVPVAPLATSYGFVLTGVLIGTWLMVRAGKLAGPATSMPGAEPAPASTPQKAPPKVQKQWRSCNVLDTSTDINHLWQFSVGAEKFKLDREQSALAGTSFPSHLINKGWHALWHPRLNVAWLPAESVFLRVVHLPQTSQEEMLDMVELQLEKLSPIPVTQVVWSASRFGEPTGPDALQTLVVVLAERKIVEEFLGRLEGRGFLADRLELPVLDQLESTQPHRDGAWIYPGAWSGPNNTLVAWWYGGILQNINLITLPETPDRMARFREQLVQTAWAGELEGWLTSPPAWHLVADAATAAEWEESLRGQLDGPVETFLSLSPSDLAARTARRASRPEATPSVMLPEYATRYNQQYVDRLWGRALLAVGAAWIVFVAIYLAAVAVLDLRTQKVEQQAAATSVTYTNTILLKAKLQVLKERQELKYAALDCWQAVAETMPEIVDLQGFTFSDGHRLTLNGTAPNDRSTNITDFNVSLRKWTKNGVSLFDAKAGDTPGINLTPNSPTLTWRFALELERSEANE